MDGDEMTRIIWQDIKDRVSLLRDIYTHTYIYIILRNPAALAKGHQDHITRATG